MGCCGRQSCLGWGWMFAVLATLALILAASTDSWYGYDTKDVKDADIRLKYDFYFGLTRTCFKNYNYSTLKKDDPAVSRTDGMKYNFVLCYQHLLRKIPNQNEQDTFDILQIVTFSCMAGAILLLFFSHWWIVAGIWKRQSYRKRKCYYCLASLFTFFAAIAGSAALISFIAQRQYEDGDKATFPKDDQLKAGYGWSFSVGWTGIGCCLISSFLLTLCSLRMSECCGGDEDDDMEKGFDLTPNQYPGTRY